MRGRRATFPEPQTAPPRPFGALRFDVPVEDGGHVTVALPDYSRPRLVRAFGTALRDNLTAPGVVCTPTKVRTQAEQLRRFFMFIDNTEETVDAVSAIDPGLLDRYEAWLKRHTHAGAISRRHLLARPILLLRRMEEEKPGTLASGLLIRLTYLSLEPYKNSRPRDAYGDAIAASIRRAARKQVLDAARRIALEGTLPSVPDGLHPIVADAYQQVLEAIERDGWAYSKDQIFDRMRQRAIYRGARRRTDLSCPATHARFYLTAVDIVGFAILLSLSTGLEMECIYDLKADCLRNRAKGFVDIAYFKRRAHGTEWKTLRMRDGGMTTPGGLIRLAIRLTARARTRTGSDRLWIWGSLTGLMQGISSRGIISRYFVRDHGLVDEHGAPLRLELSRLRKTYKAKWYARTGGQLEDFARGHTVEVAADHYADIPALRPVHEATVVAAIEDALQAAELAAPRIVAPAEEARIRTEGDGTGPSAAPVSESIATVLDGEQDVWLAGCAGFYDSPFGRHGEACPSPFWACLECRNAVITARKLPALIAFETFMTEQREALAEADWDAKFGRAWRRIREQILPAFPKAVVASARATAESASDLIYLPAEVVAT
ncbi:hypothetical protein [Mesorhizobium sp. J428]|uniref:hypothetical protein n=1 Tax=Mesorhizobium sp. J428 TaxID=2898440 RepID=UPI002150D8B5|nr:hypothetical protein [Mesorhizobium sp. J428]MCR5857373.1 hypothetical protein [Mesorhizobium sp. J428]